LIDRLPKLVAAQAEKANPFFRSYETGFEEFRPVEAQSTLATAIQIGNPVSYERAVKVMNSFEGQVVQVSEDELANAVALADRTGLYNCPQTGVAMGALFKLRDADVISRDERVVVISTAHGLKFSNVKIDYHNRALKNVDARYANDPLELEADYDIVKQAILDITG
jgi:threonine synthase